MAKQTNKSPAYQWYPKDILASVRVAEMPADVECWYRRALDFCWINGSLPADPKRCAAVIGKGCTVDGAKWVLEMFTTLRRDSTKKIHDRQEVERKKQAANRKKNSQAGKISAERRRQQRELAAQTEVNKRSTNVATDVPTKGSTKFNSSSSSSSSSSEKEKNEEKNEEKRPPQAAPPPEPAPEPTPKNMRKLGTRIPEPFNLTKEMREYAATKRPHIDVMEETEKFANHFRAKTGKDATKLDWEATWRNWILNSKTNSNGTHKQHHRETNVDRLKRTAERLSRYPTEAELAAARENASDDQPLE